MTDMKADIRLAMRIHGKEYEHKMYVNYTPDSDGVDERIKDCFSKWWDDSLGVYAGICAEYEDRDRERRERAEYERLREKFG